MSKEGPVRIRPVTKEEVMKVQNAMREVIEKVNKDVAEYMKHAENNARRFATAKR